MRRIVASVVIAAAGATLGAGGYGLYAHSAPQQPGFTLKDLHGAPLSAADFKGKVLLINFWATWCRPCRAEIPMLIAAQKAYGRRGLQIIGIAIDRRTAVRRFTKRFGIDYPVLADPTQGAKVQDAYAAGGDAPAGVLPYTAVVDRQGHIKARIAGALTRARLDKLVKPLLAHRG